MPLSGLTFSGHRSEYKHRVGKYKVEIKKVTVPESRELVRASRSSPVEYGMWHR
jgi:hypothetical protein